MNIALCLLTLNAGENSRLFLDALESQTLLLSERLIIDSMSNDGTPELFVSAGFRVHSIPRSSFDHGTTRNIALQICKNEDIIIFMTQDALLASTESLQNLTSAFDDKNVGAVYGRQLPRKSAGPIEAHARLFNYPPMSRTKSVSDIPTMGIKTVFISNSFAAYRREALVEVGGFPADNIVSEDTYVAAKLIENHWKIKYCADATVYHSHNYNMLDELQRYFDVGVFHARQPWIRDYFGKAEGEGKQFILSEIVYLSRGNFFLIPFALFRNLFKYIGFRLGLYEALLPNKLKELLSMQKNFWKIERKT